MEECVGRTGNDLSVTDFVGDRLTERSFPKPISREKLFQIPKRHAAAAISNP